MKMKYLFDYLSLELIYYIFLNKVLEIESKFIVTY